MSGAQAQGIVKPAMYIAVFSNVWHIFVNWLFIFGFGMGFHGAPVARVTTQWMNVLLMLAYMKV
jgi:Na+-driven multidrug efflux pump